MPSKRRILIDSSTHTSAVVCHLKARSQQEFDAWLELLKHHRLYYQYKWSHASPVNTSSVINHPNTSVDSPSSTTLAAAMATTVTAITPIAQQGTQSFFDDTLGIGCQVKTESFLKAGNIIHRNPTDLLNPQENNLDSENIFFNRYYS